MTCFQAVPHRCLETVARALALASPPPPLLKKRAIALAQTAKTNSFEHCCDTKLPREMEAEPILSASEPQGDTGTPPASDARCRQSQRLHPIWVPIFAFFASVDVSQNPQALQDALGGYKCRVSRAVGKRMDFIWLRYYCFGP